MHIELLTLLESFTAITSCINSFEACCLNATMIELMIVPCYVLFHTCSVTDTEINLLSSLVRSILLRMLNGQTPIKKNGYGTVHTKQDGNV